MLYLYLQLLVEKLVLLQRTLDTAVHQKSRAREYCQIAKGKFAARSPREKFARRRKIKKRL